MGPILRYACAAALLLGIGGSAWASVKDGVDAWSRGDYARAVAEWEKPAASGDADAQFDLAQAYKLGKGVPADLARAEALYRQAALQGHFPAADIYGLMLFQSGRRAEAMAWLTPSAERGEPRAQYVLGIAHFNGDLAPKDPVRAYALMTRAAAAGLEPARATLATMDASLPLAERQHGVALAAELEAKARAARTAQLAAEGLGSPVPPATPTAAPSSQHADARTTTTLFEAMAGIDKSMKARPNAGNWRIQLGAFGVAGNAERLWGTLKDRPALAGRQAYFVPAGKLTRLQAGPFGTRGEAQAVCARIVPLACIPAES
jgi:uncharacterized protein